MDQLTGAADTAELMAQEAEVELWDSRNSTASSVATPVTRF